MTAYVALLRGVNLLGVSSLKMADLRAIAEELGLESPRTFIASGNLLFLSNKKEQPLQAMLEKRLEKQMGRPVGVTLRTAEEMKAVAKGNPFGDRPGNNVQAFFLNGAPPADAIDSARNVEDERIALGKREVYVAYGKRGIGKSRLRLPVAEAGTARNMNSVAKIAELLAGME